MIHVTSSSFDSDTRQSDTDVHQQSNTLQLMALPVQSSGVSHPILAETTESKPLNTSESQLQVPNMTSERSQSFTDVSELQQQRRRSITMDNAVIDRLNMARMAMFIPNNTDSNTSVTIGSANETISGSVTQSGNIAVKKSSATIESIKKRGQQFSIFRRNSTNPSPKNSANAIPTINIIVSGVSTPEAISRQELSVSRSQQFSQTSIRATVAEEEELDAMGALGPSRIQAQQLKQQEQQQQQPARRLSLLASSVSWIKALVR
jgi:hypothetical protein